MHPPRLFKQPVSVLLKPLCSLFQIQLSKILDLPPENLIKSISAVPVSKKR